MYKKELMKIVFHNKMWINKRGYVVRRCVSVILQAISRFTTYLAASIDKLAEHSLCSLVRKYVFVTSDSIAIFAHYFQ
jgi:hypothetical protein